MKSVKGKALRGRSVILAILLFLLLHLSPFTLHPVFAADSSPSAKLSDELKVKLDELKKEIASKAAQLKNQVNLKLQDKAYAGTIKSKTETSLTLASSKGAKIVTVNQDTIFQKTSLKNLEEEDYVAALGDIDNNGVLTARKVVLLKQPKEEKTYLWGQIVSISDKLMTVQTRDLKKVAVTLGSADVKKGGGSYLPNNLSLRDFVILTGNIDKNDTLQTGFIYIIPQGGVIKPRKIATPSAKISSPSGSQARKKR